MKALFALIFSISIQTCSSNTTPLNNSDNLIMESNKLLELLGWETVKARDFLNKQFNKNSRNLLTKKELLKFIQLLEHELKQRKSAKEFNCFS